MNVSNKSSRVDQFEAALSPDIYRAAWRYACMLSSTRENAEDLLQDSLVRAIRAFHQLRDSDRFRSWLLCIIRRSYLMTRRSAAERHRMQHCEFDRVEETLTDYEVSDEAEESGSAELACALANLPAVQRELLTLFYLEGLSLKETAEVLNISAGAVTTRLRRARHALRRQLVSCRTELEIRLPQQG